MTYDYDFKVSLSVACSASELVLPTSPDPNLVLPDMIFNQPYTQSFTGEYSPCTYTTSIDQSACTDNCQALAWDQSTKTLTIADPIGSIDGVLRFVYTIQDTISGASKSQEYNVPFKYCTMIGPFSEASPTFEYILQGTGQAPAFIDFSAADNGSCGFDSYYENADDLDFDELTNGISISTDYDQS